MIDPHYLRFSEYSVHRTVEIDDDILVDFYIEDPIHIVGIESLSGPITMETLIRVLRSYPFAFNTRFLRPTI